MTWVSTHERGRITIPEEIRDRHGEEYQLIELESGIKLLPIPEDPLETLRGSAEEELKNVSGRNQTNTPKKTQLSQILISHSG